MGPHTDVLLLMNGGGCGENGPTFPAPALVLHDGGPTSMLGKGQVVVDGARKDRGRTAPPHGVVYGLRKLLGRSVIETAREDLEVRHRNTSAFRRRASLDRALMPLLLAAEGAKERGDQGGGHLELQGGVPVGPVEGGAEEGPPHRLALDGDKRLLDLGPLCGPAAGGRRQGLAAGDL